MKFSKLLKIIKIYKFSYYIILVISNKTKMGIEIVLYGNPQMILTYT